ncbi:MAG: 4-phosphoerythronate dehydrogenase [Chitinivibrionales bacterium]
MKIIADANIPFVEEAFAQFGDVTVVPGRSISRDMLLDASILLVRSITTADRALLNDTSIKFVATATIGVDHIDIPYLTSKSIGFASAPGSNAQSVAEYVGTALAHLSHTLGFKLDQKVLGIIGVGNVGSRVVKVAQALGMAFLLNDPPKQRAGNGDSYVSLNEVLEKSDIVTLHVPLIESGPDKTIQMVNEDFISKMKPGAILINSSRGKVVDEHAVRKLRKKLGGVVLDVWAHEPSIDCETLDIATIATPHIAGYSFDGKVRGTEMIYEAACDFFHTEKNWNGQAHLGIKPEKTIDVRSSNSPVLRAIEEAYPIMSDDARLRNIKDEQNRGAYFDALRKNYPRRLEFRHFEVLCSPRQKTIAGDILSGLGFSVIYYR